MKDQTNETFILYQHTKSSAERCTDYYRNWAKSAYQTNCKILIHFRHLEMHLIILKFRICKTSRILSHLFHPVNALKWLDVASWYAAATLKVPTFLRKSILSVHPYGKKYHKHSIISFTHRYFKERKKMTLGKMTPNMWSLPHEHPLLSLMKN